MDTGRESRHLDKFEQKCTYAECFPHLLRCGALSGGMLLVWMQFVQLATADTLILLLVLGSLLLAGGIFNRVSVRLAQGFPWILIFLSVVISCLGGMGRLFEGMAGTGNMGIAYWNQKEEDAIPYLMHGAGSREGFFLLGLVLVFLMTGFCWYLAWHAAIARTLLLAVLILIPDILLKQETVLGVIVLFLGLIGLWLYAARAGSGRERLTWTLLSACLLLAVVHGIGNREVDSLLWFKEKTLRLVEEARFGKPTLPEGNVGQAYMLKQGENVTLRVTTEEEKALYLRGYTAGRYEDGKWKPLKRAAYSGSRNGFLKWLEVRGFDPNVQYAMSQKLGSQEEKTAPVSHLVQIQNLSASRKYLYTLYSAEKPNSGGAVAKRDEGYRSRALTGATSYEISDYSPSIPGELNRLKDWMYAPDTEAESTYLEQESVYREFVYDEYTEVNDELSSLIETLFHDSDETGDESEEGVYNVTQKIRQKMEECLVYSPNPVQFENGEDPLVPFLQGQRVGNAVYFASAGVMAYRSFGIPARYAEGYLMERRKGADDSKTVNLTGRNGHAWVEVYMDGLGWVPIDVTPGYYYDTYALLRMTGLPQEIQKASVQEEQGGKLDDTLELQGDLRRSREERMQKIMVSMVLSGIILLFVFLLFLLYTGGAYRKLYEDWRIERLLARSGKEDTAGAFEEWIARQLRRIGIEMRVGWQSIETEREIMDYISEVKPGEYVRINGLLEKWFYGGERLEPDEIRVLYVFLRKIKTALDKHHRYDRSVFWLDKGMAHWKKWWETRRGKMER